MDLKESLSETKLPKENFVKQELLARPLSSISLQKQPDYTTDQAATSDHLKQFRNWVSNERWTELKKLAENAMKDRKVFTIKGGGFSTIRQALLDRGWIEKPESSRVRNNALEPQKFAGPSKEIFTRVERMILYKFMEHYAVDFFWTCKRDKNDWLITNRDVVINRFRRSIFTSKEGLCASLTQMHWYTEPGVAMTLFPRCYNIHNSDHLDEFVQDFRITACMGLLKWLCNTVTSSGVEGVISPTGKVPYTALEFATSRLEEHIIFFSHKDIDDIEEKCHVWEHEWNLFLTHHYLLVHEDAKFGLENSFVISNISQKASQIMNSLTTYWPQMHMDGMLNLWMVKPSNKCRGRGIQLMNNIKDILALIPASPKGRYVVQKYIENPLIIYDTKFDIRQWYLITNCQPLTIWMYKDSYLRFSSQIFSLLNNHESVHLTNNAVQARYKNTGARDPALPDENMWDNHTFKAYLRQIGKSEMWEHRIYPGMKQALIGAMLASQDNMDKRQNSFELYGADFMLTNDFTPWLIEVNSSPDFAPTTSVTARLCPQCLEDIVKVVFDRRDNPDADTGMFELIYRQVVPKAPAYLGLSLSVNGKKMFKKLKQEKRPERLYTPIVPKVNTQVEKENSSPELYSGPVISDFLYGLPPAEHSELQDTSPANRNNLTVHHTLTVVRSGLLVKAVKTSKTSKSKRSCRNRSAKMKPPDRDRENNYCCKLEQRATNIAHSQLRKSKSDKAINKYWHDPEANKSVGNKRCYIDPTAWERETITSLRSTASVQNRTLLPKLHKASENIQHCGFSAIGYSINKLRERKRNVRGISDGGIDSTYSPYRLVLTPTGKK